MKRLIVATLAALLVGTVTLRAEQSPKSSKNKHAKHSAAHVAATDDRDDHVAIHVAFGSSDIQVIRAHYAPQYRNLPPGLQKKVARGGKLPPGWQKKLEPFPVALEVRLPPLTPKYRRGVVDGHAVIYDAGTQVIIDVAVLF
jgi:hypothetical protein